MPAATAGRRAVLLAASLMAVLAAVAVFAFDRAEGQTPSPAPTGPATPTLPLPTAPATPYGDELIIAAGDIGRCDSKADERTAKLVQSLRGTVLVLGDNVYNKGTAKEFATCYAPSWGPLLFRTWGVAGNHDRYTPSASAYFDYFGPRAGPDRRGYYSLDLGAWHVVALDSECLLVGGCDPASPQGRWLSDDLAAHPASCLLAFWHRPRYSSGRHGDDPGEDGLWRAVVAAGADVILNGHDHDYERLDLLSADGSPDPAGVREFVVGTGGASFTKFTQQTARSAFRDDGDHGVLTMTLSPNGYAWAFLRTPDGAVVDHGNSSCQNTGTAAITPTVP